jgi:hypothetical protein
LIFFGFFRNPKLNVEGSIPFARFNDLKNLAKKNAQIPCRTELQQGISKINELQRVTLVRRDKSATRLSVLMHQIDAATAVKILVAAPPSDTAQPMHQAMRFLLEAARRSRISMRAFRGAKPEHEPIPTAVLSELEIDFLARANRADDAGGTWCPWDGAYQLRGPSRRVTMRPWRATCDSLATRSRVSRRIS